ncbi:FHA domain-containing protein [Fimbriiglobus ruber]|uniref:FHA domain-containing protein n=1 Tax=Fimbriiglobus ruber TaxID=1908690 RepID=UPI00117B4408|nr:FHA domain-containing protein [Fimbriiglobus ruber]
MTVSLSTQFAQACGATAPVHLRIDRTDGTHLTSGDLDVPFALVGRDPDCEITLVDQDVSIRHACIQVVEGRILLADVGSRTGLHTLTGPKSFTFLSPNIPVRIGPFLFTANAASAARPPIPGPDYNPFLPAPAAAPKIDSGSRVGLRFLNGRTVRAEWEVNRTMTFIGRAKDCKICLSADNIAPYHGYFLRTPKGLWVVDLVTEAGTWVNDEAVRYKLLSDGDVVRIGQFELGCVYLDSPVAVAPPPVVPAANRPAPRNQKPVSPPAPAHAPRPKTEPPRAANVRQSAPPATPAMEPPITLIPAPPVGATIPPSAPEASISAMVPNGSLTAIALPALPEGMDPTVSTLLRQMSSAQGHMIEQFQQSLMTVMQMFGTMHREQMLEMQQELARMASLSGELQDLQARLAGSPGLKPVATSTLPDPTLLPPVSEATADHHNWVYERMSAVQAERHGIWQKLFGMVSAKTAGAS